MSRLALFLLLGFIVAAFAGVGGFAYLALRRPGPASDVYVESQINDIHLNYPIGYARFPLGRAGGRLDRLELAATIPDMRPAGDLFPMLPAGGETATQNILFLSVGPEQKTAPPDRRAALLYANFLDAEIVDENNGLIMRRFQAGSPYENEDLYLDPPDGRLFAARCMRPTPAAVRLPLTCVAAMRLNNLDVDLRFGREALPYWNAIAAGARSLIASITAH